ncbi:MAG: glucose 1-dehydrogenase [Rhodospirillales bacterium]|nr:glucose 1-dehydrogenase [Rhodospirillales bacterium]
MIESERKFDPRSGFRLDGQVCLITGGARGIGRAVGFAAARSGARVHLLDRDGDAAAATAADIMAEGGSAVAHTLDVTDEAALVATFDAIAAREGRIDALVNNAGMAMRRPSIDLPRAEWDRVVELNLTAVFLCARTAARHMLAGGAGAIVNLASIMGLSGGGLYPNISYQATKGAVVNLTRALAVEWAPGIRVNAVAPTWVRTDFIAPLLAQPDLIARIEATMPMRRLAEAEEVAAAVLFLLSPAAAMVTGHTLPVDGGFLAQ